ncbi:MAG TPA: hypothetical protein VFN62_13285 [Acidobacteriaceae bacterium]|nr:hypothetical protein [Acidobacteriaceae bacterium]
MTKTPIRDVPRKLPHARIYLDDLFEVEDILKAYADRSDVSFIGFEYEIDNKVKLTTRDELKEHEGYSSRFSLIMVADPRLSTRDVLSITRYLNPEFVVPYLLEDQRWAIFAEVEQVFKARKDSLKNVITSFPGWFIFVLLLAIFACSSLANLRAITRYVDARAFYLFEALFESIALMAWYAVFRRNRVYFRYARRDQQERAAAWRKRLEKFLWILLGTFLGAVATFLVSGHIRR